MANDAAWHENGTASHLVAESTTTNATLLVVAYGPRWTTAKIYKMMPAELVHAFVRIAAIRVGFDRSHPIPFIIKGTIHDVSAYVVNGSNFMN